jgi:hypothetical protein
LCALALCKRGMEASSRYSCDSPSLRLLKTNAASNGYVCLRKHNSQVPLTEYHPSADSKSEHETLVIDTSERPVPPPKAKVEIGGGFVDLILTGLESNNLTNVKWPFTMTLSTASIISFRLSS